MHMPRAIIFDVNETLFSLESLDPIFDECGLVDLRELWFARTLRTGFALTCLGDYRSFPEIARATFAALAPGRIGSTEQDALMEAFGTLQVQPDVPHSLDRLGQAGVPMVTLSVGSAANVERISRATGVDRYFDRHLSCESVRRWKPSPEPYRYACDVLDLPPHDVMMIAAHSWDVGGAACAGLRTAWISRLEGMFDVGFRDPDIRGADLADVVDQLLALPR